MERLAGRQPPEADREIVMIANKPNISGWMSRCVVVFARVLLRMYRTTLLSQIERDRVTGNFDRDASSKLASVDFLLGN